MKNCDEIGFDPNSKWHKVVCNYKLFKGKIMWKVQTGERAPFCCTLLVFTRAYGQCFMPPVVVHQAKDYSQDLHHNITFDWTIHHTPYGYIDRDRWLKAMIQLSIICGTSPVNNQILFLDGHNSHFNDRALTQMQGNKSSPSYLNRLNP